MASRPEQPPESIILGQFRGIRNTGHVYWGGVLIVDEPR